MYEKGTIKITWINPKDFSVLESQMFNKVNLQEALKVANTKPNFMVFELTENKGNYYKWKLLPYGEHDRFIRAMEMNANPLYKIALFAFIGFGIYGIYKTLK